MPTAEVSPLGDRSFGEKNCEKTNLDIKFVQPSDFESFMEDNGRGLATVRRAFRINTVVGIFHSFITKRPIPGPSATCPGLTVSYCNPCSPLS